MPDAILDGNGNGYLASVSSGGFLLVAGSISSMPSISVGSLSVSAGSESYLWGKSGTGYVPVSVDSQGYLNVVASVSAGSTSYVPAGSVIITNMVAGSIVYMPPVNVAVGSESYVKAGSVIVTNTVNINGSIGVTSGSVSITNTSLPVWTGVGSIYGIGVGSMYVSVGAPATIGSFTTQNVGVTAGSVQIYNPVGIGSVLVTNTALSVLQSNPTGLKAQIEGTTANDSIASGINPLLVGGYASNAVPTEVGSDNDSVRMWLMRNGATINAIIPHLAMTGNPYTLANSVVQKTAQTTGSQIWTPAAGKKIAITSYQIQAGGTTAGTVQLWFGASGDTTYTRGTDSAIFDGEFAPSSTLKPGVVQNGLWISPTADHILRLTDSAAINPLTINVWGYEF